MALQVPLAANANGLGRELTVPWPRAWGAATFAALGWRERVGARVQPPGSLGIPLSEITDGRTARLCRGDIAKYECLAGKGLVRSGMPSRGARPRKGEAP